MKVLSQEKIREEIKSPSKKLEIEAAIAQQERIKFHADTNVCAIKGKPYSSFETFVRSLLPSDKFAVTMNLLKFPIPTNEITDSVFTKLSKIFDGRNPANNYQFHNTQERDDWEYYRQEKLREPSVWANKAWEYFKTEINCVMVVDMPSEVDATDKYPQPYFYFVPIDSVISYKVDKMSGNMKWIIFTTKDEYVVIDGFSYRTYAKVKDRNTNREELGELLSDNPHGLPYCPARFFWSEPLSLSTPDIKKSPLSKELAALDYYLFRDLAKKHLDLYGSYPIYSGYEEECDYQDKDGNRCSHGVLQKPDGDYLTDPMGNIVPCPKCKGKKALAGPGSYIEVPVPMDGQPDMRNPVQMLTIDKSSLDYNVQENERLKANIIAACVGVDNSIVNEASLTDKQIEVAFESQDAVLNRVKKGFEEAQEWVDTTCCILRYGDLFISAKINYGTEFYTLTAEVLRSRYTKAKEGGASQAELDAIRQQLIETEYRHNPLMLQRMLILSDIEPYVHLNNLETKELYEGGLITKEEYLVKKDFSGYIRRFERENDNILEFGAQKPYSNKIEIIYNTLLNYARGKQIEEV